MISAVPRSSRGYTGQKGRARESAVSGLRVDGFEQSCIKRDVWTARPASSISGKSAALSPAATSGWFSGSARTSAAVRAGGTAARSARICAAHSRSAEIASLMAARVLLRHRGTQGNQGCARPTPRLPRRGCPHNTLSARSSSPAGQFGDALRHARRERPMLRPDDDHTRARVMFELVMATATDINQAFPLPPGDDLAGAGVDGRHGIPPPEWCIIMRRRMSRVAVGFRRS